MLKCPVVLFVLVTLISADVVQVAYPVIVGTAILNSIAELITRNESVENHQKIIEVIFEQRLYSNGNFNTDIQNYSKILNNLKVNIGTIVQNLEKNALTSQEPHRRINENKDEFGRIYNGLHVLGRILNSYDAKLSKDIINSTLETENVGSLLISFNEKLHKFQATLNKIDNSYRNFMEYSTDITSISNHTLLEYATTISKENSTTSDLNDLQSSFGKGGTLPSFLKQGVIKHIVCQKRTTPQHLVYSMYQSAIIAELKVLLIKSFVQAVQYHQNIKNFGKNVSENHAKNTLERINNLNSIFTSFLMSNTLERHLYTCGSPSIDNVEDEYYQLKNFLQVVFVRSKTYGRNHSVLLDHKRCKGKLFGCKPAGFWIAPNVCLSDSKIRRYEFLSFTSFDKSKPNKVSIVKYGKQCSNPTKITDNSTYDTCLCDAIEEKEQERYISLDIVNSDTKNNMVITGVKLVNHSNGVRFQIQQAKLTPGGAIDPSTAHWVELGKHQNNNRFELLQNRRRIDLDIFDGEPGFLVTGVRFSNLTDGVTIEVEITSFNSTTGNLDRNNVKWLRNDNSTRQRKRINLEHVSPPGDAKSAFPQSKTNQFIQFDITGITEDIGQTLVPFFDKRPVYSSVLTPLAGLGMQYISAGPRFGGYLSPVLIGLNYIDYIEKEIQDDIASISIQTSKIATTTDKREKEKETVQLSEKSSSVNNRISYLLYAFVILLYIM